MIAAFRNFLLLVFLSFCVAQAQTPWLATERHGNEARFLFSNQILRYDLAARSWLSPVSLSRSGVTAIASDDAGTVITYGSAIYTGNASFGNQTLLASASSDIQYVGVDGNLVIVAHAIGITGQLSAFDRTTGALLSTRSTYINNTLGASFAPNTNRVFGRTSGTGPADIVMSSYTDAGELTFARDSPYHGVYPNATRTWVFPDEGKVIDSSGTAYNAADLTYYGTTAGTVTDIGFDGDVPIVLRGSELISFTPTLTEVGRGPVGNSTGAAMFLQTNDAFVFSPASSGNPLVTIVPLSSIKAPVAGPPVEPKGLKYAADNIFPARDGSLLLFSKANRSLFRWSPSQRDYTASMPLVGTPNYAAYSGDNDAAYFAYDNQMIRKLDLTAAAPGETPLFTGQPGINGFWTAGQYIFATTTASGLATHYLYAPDGTQTGVSSFGYSSRVWEWDPVLRRLYYFRDNVQPTGLHYDVIDTNGVITGNSGTGYDPTFIATPPLRVSPDGTRIATGRGQVLETTTMTQTATLANSFTDGVWSGSKLVTLRAFNSGSQLQTWDGPQLTAGAKTLQLAGDPSGVFHSGENFVIVTSVDGAPRFTIVDASLNVIYASPVAPLSPGSLSVASRTDSSVTLTWQDLSQDEEGFRVEYRQGTGEWITGATVPANATTATVGGLLAGTSYDFRVSSFSGALVSSASAPVSTQTRVQGDPAGEPYNLAIARVFSSSITLSWTDNTSGGTGFRILRSLTPTGAPATFTVAAGSTTYEAKNLTPNITYYFRVQAINGDIAGDLSAQVSAKTLSSDVRPFAPSDPVASNVSASSITLTWIDNSTNENSFEIDRLNPLTSAWDQLVSLPYNSTSYTDATVKPGTSYTYRVRATNTRGSTSSGNLFVSTLALGGDYSGLMKEAGGVAYFAFSKPNRIERYDLSSRAWLTPVPLEATATALWADELGIYAAEGSSVFRFNLDGTGRTGMGAVSGNVGALYTVNRLLAFAASGGRTTILDKVTGATATGFETDSYKAASFSVAPAMSRAFFRSANSSPSSIRYYQFDANGFADTGSTPNFGMYPDASRTFVFPNGGQVADNSGNVYSTDSLLHTNTLGAAFTDLAFYGSDVPVVLRDNQLYCYDNTLTQTGSFQLEAAALKVSVAGTDALAFIADGGSEHGFRIQAVPLAQLSAPQPDTGINPAGLVYTPDDVFIDNDGTVLLVGSSRLSVFRWSPAGNRYLSPVPLTGTPAFSAFSRETNRLYLAYASQPLRNIDFSAPQPQEKLSFVLPERPIGLGVAGTFPYVPSYSGARTFTPDGQVITSTGFGYDSYSAYNTWEPVKRRIYHFRDGTTPNDLLYDTIDATGAITGSNETPYHGSFRAVKPIVVSADGSKVVIGGGVVFETQGLTILSTLPNPVTDAVWTPAELLTLENAGTSQSVIRRWDASTFAPTGFTSAFTGTPVKLLPLPQGGYALVTLDRGMPRFYVLGANLSVLSDFVPDVPHLVGTPPPATEDTPFSWTPEVQFRATSGPITLTAPVLPSWLSLVDGTLVGTPLEADSGDQESRSMTHRVVLRAIDAQGHREEKEFQIVVAWVNDPPTFEGSPLPVVADDKADSTVVDFGPYLRDPDAKDPHQWRIAGNTNPGLFSSLMIDAAGRLSITYAPYVSGSSHLTIEVADASGATAQEELDVTLPSQAQPTVELSALITLNRATGLYEQTVTITNPAARAIGGFDLSLSGLRQGVVLYNGASPGDGTGTLAYHRPLQPGESVTLTLEYFASPRGTIPQPVTSVSLALPEDPAVSEATGPGFAVDRMVHRDDGSFVLEFPSEPGALYQVEYSQDAAVWKVCPYPIRSGGTRVQWIDRGPPWTDAAPGSVSTRLYRIQKLPQP